MSTRKFTTGSDLFNYVLSNSPVTESELDQLDRKSLDTAKHDAVAGRCALAIETLLIIFKEDFSDEVYDAIKQHFDLLWGDEGDTYLADLVGL